MNPSILAVPGLAANTDQEFRAALWAMAERNLWNVDAIAATMSIESGFKPAAKNPKASASGLIQFIESTAKKLGTTTAELRTMSAVQQLPYVEKYLLGTLPRTPRVVDYYLAVWMPNFVGRPDATVIAKASDQKIFNNNTENYYTLNSGLDGDRDGAITVSDIRNKIEGVMARAGGVRLDASPKAQASSGVSASSVSPVTSSSAPFPPNEPPSVPKISCPLPVLRPGAYGNTVELFFRLVAGTDAALYASSLVPVVREFQTRHKLLADGVVGPLTWGALLRTLKPSTSIPPR